MRDINHIYIIIKNKPSTNADPKVTNRWFTLRINTSFVKIVQPSTIRRISRHWIKKRPKKRTWNIGVDFLSKGCDLNAGKRDILLVKYLGFDSIITVLSAN